jgi:hypothetical protein
MFKNKDCILELNLRLGLVVHPSRIKPEISRLEDELKSAFISICMADWQQEFLKTEINGKA